MTTLEELHKGRMYMAEKTKESWNTISRVERRIARLEIVAEYASSLIKDIDNAQYSPWKIHLKRALEELEKE